jgi:hypothetical protein
VARRKLKPAVVLVSDIGASAMDLHGYGYLQTIEAMNFLYRVNPDIFDWLREMLNSAHAQRTLTALRKAKANASSSVAKAGEAGSAEAIPTVSDAENTKKELSGDATAGKD